MLTQRDFWHWLFVISAYIQLGNFLETVTPWGKDPLFWPLWTSWFIMMIAIVKLFDCKSVNSDES